jgi:hypothetical protein
MVSSLVQTPVNKFNSEFVDKATEIIDLIYAHADGNCPHCLELLKSGLGNQPNPADEPVPEPVIPNVSQKPNV